MHPPTTQYHLVNSPPTNSWPGNDSGYNFLKPLNHMVKIKNFKTAFNAEGKEFTMIQVTGEVEAVQSKQSGRMYLTVRTAMVPTTFDEATAESLIGNELPGRVEKVACPEYEYTVPESGEVVTLTHRFEYVPDEIHQPASKPIPAERVQLLEA